MSRLIPVAAGWTARAVVIGCAFVNTRLLLDLVGVNGYAAFSIVLSLAPWLALLNMGLPNTAQNLIAERRARGLQPGRLRRAAIDTAFAVGLLYLPLVLLAALLVQHLLLPSHGSMSFASVTLLLWALVLLGLTTVFHQVLHAMHRSTWPVVAPAVQAALTAAMLLGARGATMAPHHRELWGSLATALPILTVFLISAFIAGARQRARLDGRALRRLLHAARGFLLFGLTGTMALSCDYIVMSRLLQSAQVAEYNLASKTFGTILTLHSVLLAASWTPLSDRFFRGDLAGVRRQLVRVLGMGLVLVTLIGLPLVLGMDLIVRLLTGGKIEALPLALTLGWLMYVAMRVWSDSFATALLSCNQVAVINRYIVWQSLISVTAQWLLASRWGAPGIVLGILVSFLLTAGWILPLRFLSITRPAHPETPATA